MKNLNEIIESLKNSIRTKNPQINVNEGTIVNDILINVPAQEISNLYNELGNVSNKILLNNLTSDELDSLGSTLLISRKLPFPARGKVTFRAINVTTPITIPAGTLVGTSPLSLYKNISYSLDSDVIIDSNSRIVGGYYEADGYVTCTYSGSIGNIPANTISLIVSSVDSKVVGVYNPESISGGSDLESDEEYLNRIILLVRSGSSVGSLSYLKYSIISHPSVRVLDYHMYLPNDPNLKRNPYGDSIDVYVVSRNEFQTTETFTSGNSVLIPSHKPVISVITQGVTFVQDTNSDYSKSAKSLDRFEVNPNNGPFTITYIYNKNIEDLQNWIDDPDKKPLTLDVLIKEAKRKFIKIDVYLHKKNNYDSGNVRTNVLNNLKSFINTNKLNQIIYLSDIVGVIEMTEGVDYVDTDINGNLKVYMYFKGEFEVGYNSQAQTVISASEIEYFVFDDLNSIINIS